MQHFTKPIKDVQKKVLKNFMNNNGGYYKSLLEKQGQAKKIYLNQIKGFNISNFDNYKNKNITYMNNIKDIRKSAKQEKNHREQEIKADNRRPQSYAGKNKNSQNINSSSLYSNNSKNIKNNRIYKSSIDIKEIERNNNNFPFNLKRDKELPNIVNSYNPQSIPKIDLISKTKMVLGKPKANKAFNSYAFRNSNKNKEVLKNSLKSQKQKQSGTDKLLKEIKQKKEFHNNKNMEYNALQTQLKNDIQNNKNLMRGIENSDKFESS